MKQQTTISTAHEAAKIRPILDRTFRANPGYELVAFNRLSAEQQDLFANLRRDPDFFGILRPKGDAQLAVKSACRDTALMFYALQEPGVLPAFVLSGEPEEANRAMAKLVLDAVFEMESGGRMVHGAEALAEICEPPASGAPISEIARLSQQAMQYGQSLPFNDASALSARLYSYGRIAMSPAWKRKFPGEGAVRQCLGLDEGAENARRLDAQWHPLPADPGNDGWIAFQSRQASLAGATMYKLYVSPRPDSLRQAFDAMVPVLTGARAKAFKVGKDLAGVLRPDKFVAYFSRFEHVERAAGAILARLSGCPSHGVPFTAELGSPLVSWGIDPPSEEDAPVWLSRQSWRLWVTNRLAVALLAGTQNAAAGLEPWKFAVERLRLEGVDTDTWSPMRKGNN